MAQRIQLVDDVDGSDAVETVSFGLDGAKYEIDLSESNAEQLRADLEKWVQHARKTTLNRRVTGARAPRDTPASRVREWAQANGIEVNERGRVSSEVRAAYHAANPS